MLGKICFYIFVSLYQNVKFRFIGFVNRLQRYEFSTTFLHISRADCLFTANIVRLSVKGWIPIQICDMMCSKNIEVWIFQKSFVGTIFRQDAIKWLMSRYSKCQSNCRTPTYWPFLPWWSRGINLPSALGKYLAYSKYEWE